MSEEKQMKNRLEDELGRLHFSKQEEVLREFKQSNSQGRFHAFWNKEITIHLFPISSVFVLLLFGYGFYAIFEEIETPTEYIEIGGNTYLKEEVEGRITDED